MKHKTKRLFTALLVAAVPFVSKAQYIETVERSTQENVPVATFAEWQRSLFNFGWRFQLGNPKGAETVGYDDSQWRTLDLPHDFQFELPWIEDGDKGRGFKPMAEGWYRKTFRAESAWRDKQVLLDFGGVIFVCDVYINGHKVKSHEYGYVGFEADISKYLNYDGDNVVAVYASTGPVNGSRWYTGGGIFRDVNVMVRNTTHIARHGVYVHTPEVSEQRASVQVEVEVDGWQKHDNVFIRSVVRSPEGAVLATVESPMPDHTVQRSTEVKLPLVSVEKPQLWSPDTPTLYNVEVTVHADGMTVDSLCEQFGIRHIEYGTDFGFKLNGKKVFLKGIANHHDLGALGAASFDKAIERQMRVLKSFGFNAIRCSHNPYSESFTRIADRVGILIVDELIDKWSDKDYWGGREPFMSIWPGLIKEWVRRDRNCPSVVLWSLGNELQTRSDWSGYDTNDWGITTYRIFDQMVKRYDPTRKTTVAMFPARAGAQRGTPDFKTYLVPPELACVTDVASFNYQWDAYHGYYDYKPDLILFQSEATANQLLQPYYGMNRERGVGLAYWGPIEYWGESTGWPKKGWNYSYFSHTLEPYPQAYLLKSAFDEDEPVVRIGVLDGKGETIEWNDNKVGMKPNSYNWNRPAGTRQNVFAYTNAEEVELFLNGKSLGVQKNDTTAITKRNMTYWAGVEYEPGTLLAVARTGGKEVARHQIQTSGKPVALRIELETYPNEKVKQPTLTADGMDLQYIRIYAVDAKGRVVPDATDEVTVKVTGAATLKTLDNGDHYTDELFHDINTKHLHNGFLQAIARSKTQGGNVTIVVSSPTLKGAKATFKSVLPR